VSVTLCRQDREIEIVPIPDQSLFHAITARSHDLIVGLCGGCCICGTCRVRVLAGDPGPMAEAEGHVRRQLSITDPSIRLACKVRPASSPLRIEII